MTDANRKAFEIWAEPIFGDNPTWKESGDCELAWRAWLAALRAQPVPEVGFGNIAQPAAQFKKLSDEEVLWIAQSHGIDVYASNPLAFYADLISTTPAQPDHSELVKAVKSFHTWAYSQRKQQSKGGHESFDFMELREQMDIAEAALAAIGETME